MTNTQGSDTESTRDERKETATHWANGEPKTIEDLACYEACCYNEEEGISQEKDLKSYLEQQIAEAKKEQVMQDFLDLSVNSNEDEVVLIGWRDGQLAQLTKDNNKEK